MTARPRAGVHDRLSALSGSAPPSRRLEHGIDEVGDLVVVVARLRQLEQLPGERRDGRGKAPQLGGLVGPALSGILIHAVGEGWSFGINSLACGFVVSTLLRMRPRELYPSPVTERAKGQLRDGLRYVLRQPTIFWTVIMIGFVAVFGMNMPVLLTAFAKSVFHVGPGGYGLFNSLVALGALSGALASTRRTRVRLRSLAIAATLFGVVQAMTALAPDQLGFSIGLVGIGAATLVFLTGANSLVQMTANLRLRGRVMSLYMLVLLGGQAIGGVVTGRITEALGPRTAMFIAGLVPTTATIVIAILLARVQHKRRMPDTVAPLVEERLAA